jgi:hypothetical protein
MKAEEAKVTEIVQDPAGNVETIVADKGTIFRKRLEIPVERVQSVAPDTGGDESDSPGKVIVAATEEEVEALAAVGPEALPPDGLTRPPDEDDLLDLTGNALSTDVGLRSREDGPAGSRASVPQSPGLSGNPVAVEFAGKRGGEESSCSCRSGCVAYDGRGSLTFNGVPDNLVIRPRKSQTPGQ